MFRARWPRTEPLSLRCQYLIDQKADINIGAPRLGFRAGFQLGIIVQGFHDLGPKRSEPALGIPTPKYPSALVIRL